MQGRFVIIAAAAVALASGAFAEPVKAPTAQENSTGTPPKDVVLASADTVKGPPSDPAQPSASAPKRRAARITTCRCGDPQPDASDR